MRPTLKKIAEYAGVSLGTASRVINKKGYVSEELTLRVQAVVEKLNYTPNTMAQSVRRNRTDVIGLIIPKIKSDHYVEMIYALENYVTKKNHAMFLVCSDEEPEKELSYLDQLLRMRVAGVVLSTSMRPQDRRLLDMVDRCNAMGVPMVSVMRSLTEASSEKIIDEVAIDNASASYEAVTSLLDRGHRKIGLILCPSHSSTGQERKSGYVRALNEFRQPYDASLVVDITTTSVGVPYQETMSMLSRPDRPTALFVAGSFPVVGALKAISDSGLRVPDEFSVVCFDDPPWASFMSPPLTTVRPLTEELCSLALEFLFDRIEDRYSGPPRTERIASELIIRQSIGVCPDKI